jgi:alpha-acetolactate decarboxylase
MFGLILTIGPLVARTLCAAETDDRTGNIIQYGKMRDAIGGQQHQGHVRISHLVRHPHFYGVAALEKLDGEVTIHDGEITATRVAANGRLAQADVWGDLQATFLIGAYVPAWTEHVVTHDVGPDELDRYLARQASQAGVDSNRPFVFLAEGEFKDVRLHVIHGACPMHARLKRIELPEKLRPFEADLEKVNGTIVGVFARDAVGDLTHPATMIHAHLLFTDPDSGKLVTGHVEQMGMVEGTTLRFPQ